MGATVNRFSVSRDTVAGSAGGERLALDNERIGILVLDCLDS